jgi:geranylgeranylglycerol-phosphate geranylgeranyltransferase
MQCPKQGIPREETHYLQKVRQHRASGKKERKSNQGIICFMNMKAFVELLRPINAVMSMVGVYVGYSIAVQQFVFNESILLALVSVAFISGAGQAINDYFDLEIDKKTGKKKPLVLGTVTKNQALVFSIALFLTGTYLASLLNEFAFYIAVFFSIILFLYSATMKDIKFVGNAVVSFGVAFTYIFGASIAGVTPLVLMVATAAFFANWAREVIKDVEDKKTDRGHKLTLPLILSKHSTQFVILALLAAALIAGYFPVIFAGAGIFYTILITIGNIVFILAAQQLLQQHASQSQKTIKRAMLIALAAQLSLLL